MPAMTLGYGIYAKLPLSIYIENVFIAVQSLVVLCLFSKYKQPNYEKDKNKMKIMFLASMVVSGMCILQLVPNYMQEISIWLQLVVCNLSPLFSLSWKRITTPGQLQKQVYWSLVHAHCHNHRLCQVH